jgi:elongin-A
MEAEGKAPSLLELCVRKAIDNLRRIESVDGVDTPLLRRILPHCDLEQLTRIESRTATDLTPVTDVLWQGFYRRQFGEEHTSRVADRMRRAGARYRWKDLFRAKTKQQKEVEDRMVEALTNKCRARNAERQSKSIKRFTKLQPSSCKRSYFGRGPSGISSRSGYKNPMLKKARMEVDIRAKMEAPFCRRSTTSHGQPMRTMTIRRPNSTSTITKPTAVNRPNQNNRSRF